MRLLIDGSPGCTCVAACSSAEDALARLPVLQPDVVLMDIQLPGISGIECIRSLKRLRPSIQLMMLTVFEDHDRIFQSLTAGASGYLLKQTPPDKLPEAITDLHHGGSAHPPSEWPGRPLASTILCQSSRAGSNLPEELRRWVQHERARLAQLRYQVPAVPLDVPARLAPVDSNDRAHRGPVPVRPQRGTVRANARRMEQLGLMPREVEVLHWLCEGKTNPEIVELLGTSRRTVDKNVEHILAKLGVKTRAGAVRVALSRRCLGDIDLTQLNPNIHPRSRDFRAPSNSNLSISWTWRLWALSCLRPRRAGLPIIQSAAEDLALRSFSSHPF